MKAYALLTIVALIGLVSILSLAYSICYIGKKELIKAAIYAFIGLSTLYARKEIPRKAAR